jgi:hypothetical protein
MREGKRDNIGMREVLKRVMVSDTMIMKRVWMLLTKMKGAVVAVNLKGPFMKIMTITMMMTTPKWVGVIYLSHQ